MAATRVVAAQSARKAARPSADGGGGGRIWWPLAGSKPVWLGEKRGERKEHLEEESE